MATLNPNMNNVEIASSKAPANDDLQAIIATCPTPTVVASRQGRGKAKGKAKGGRAKKEVQTTWEIEPSKLSFGNTVWQNYVDTTLCVMLCKTLGVRIGNSLPKMELSKLLVYETGAHLLPDEEETHKIDGVFGTAVILLPSAYTGGQVVVSHGSTIETIDFAKDSMLSTAFLAWYNGVNYELKPVESGYRVALAYNLVYDPQEIGVPFPCLPDMTIPTNELRSVLKKWKSDKGKENLPPFIAYLLKERHDPFIFKIQGLNALKGVDLHQMTVVRPVAEEEGFRVYIASLEHKVSGFSEPTYQKRRRDRYDSLLYDLGWSDDDDIDNTRVISEINSVTTKFTELKGMDGASLLFDTEIDVGSNCLVPNKPFEGKEPDKVEDKSYVCSQVVYCYRRTALILIPEDTADDILYKALGASYAHRMLSKSTNIPPSSEDRKWAERLLNSGKSLKELYIPLLLKVALNWKDIELWKSTTINPLCTVSTINSKTLMNPMEVFTFEELRESFEALLERSKSLTDNMDFLSKFSPNGSSHENDSLKEWYHKEIMKNLSSYSSAKVEDIPTLLTIIRLVGLQCFSKLVMPNLRKQKGYGFWMGFVKALCNHRIAILEQQSYLVPFGFNDSPRDQDPSPPPTAESIVDGIIKQGLKIASIGWSSVGLGPDYYFNRYAGETPTLIRDVKFDRIIEVLEHAIVMSDWETCKTIFDDMLTSKWFTASQKVNVIFLPLLPRLRELLTKKNLTQFQPPFADFIRSFVGLYLREILGKRTELSVAHMHKVGCPGKCEDCHLLDDFIMNPRVKTTLIRAPKARRLHLERRADEGLDLYTYEIIKSTSPHGLQFTKLPAVIEASTWTARQKAAKVFLDTVGPWSDLSRIMGDRVLDVKHAYEGSRPYDTPSASTTAPLTKTTTGTGTTTTQNSSQSLASVASSSSTAVHRKVSETGFPQQDASKKRKI